MATAPQAAMEMPEQGANFPPDGVLTNNGLPVTDIPNLAGDPIQGVSPVNLGIGALNTGVANPVDWPTITYGTFGTDGEVETRTTTSDGTPFYLRDEDGGGMYQNPNTIESYRPFTGQNGETYYAVHAPVFSSGKQWNETPVTSILTEAEYKALKGGSSAVGNMLESPVGQFALNVTGLAPFVNTYNAVESGDVLGTIGGVAGIGGYSDIANAANTANALKNKDVFGLGMTAANAAGIQNVGGIDTQDISGIVNTTRALQSGNPAALMGAGADYTQRAVGSPTDTQTAASTLASMPDTSSIYAPTDVASVSSALGYDPTQTLISDAPYTSTPIIVADAGNRSIMNAGPATTRTAKTGPGLSPGALSNWGGNKIDPNFLKAASPYLGWDPSTYFPNINVRMASPTAAFGNVPEYDYSPSQQSYLSIAPYLTSVANEYDMPALPADVLSHELAHVGQKLSSKPGEDPTKLYLRMANEAGLSTTDVFNRPSDITNFNKALNEALPYINKTYGNLSTSYVDDKNASSSKLFEKLTDLAALEMQTGKDLTKDPVLKETLFKDPRIQAMYNTLTIPRMTRLDPRDLPTGTVTSSDFPKGEIPLFQHIKNMLPAPSKGWVRPFAKGGIAEVEKGMDFSSPQDTITTTSPQGTDMATAPQATNPYSDPNTMAVYEQMRQNVSPKEFGDQVLAGAAQVDPQEVAKFKAALDQIQLPPEALDLLNNMVDEILANPEKYAEIRAKYKEMGAPDEILPEQFDAHFFTALNMAVDQMIGAPSGEQAFAKGGIAELKPVSKAIADYGRNGDTMLAHITPAEARMLRRKGGSGTINPKTGLPEYFNLFKEIGNAFKSIGNAVKDFAKSTVGRIVTTVALGFFLGPAAASMLGATSTAAVAAISGFVGSAGSTLLAGGNLSQALKAGAVGGITAGAVSGVSGGFSTDYAGPTTVGGQIDRVFGPSTAAPLTAPPAQIPVETRVPSFTEAELAKAGTDPSRWSDQTAAMQRAAGNAPTFTETPANAAEQVFKAPATTTIAPPADVASATTNIASPATTAPLANAPMPSASATTAATGNAIAPPIQVGNPMDATQFEGSLAKPLTAPPATVGPSTVAPPTDTSLFDSAKDFYNKNISPTGIQQAGMPAAQEAGAKAVTDLVARIPDATPAMKEAAYQNAFKAASPGILATYGPMTAVGLGAVGAFGGFSPRPVQESALSKTLKGGPGSAEALMRENPYRFYVQGLPGVQYYNGSLMKPPGMATGGIVDAMPEHFAIGGGVDQQLYDAYRAGDSAKVNQIIKANNVTAQEIQTRFNLTPADMAWIDNQAGVDFYTPPANTNTTVTNTNNAATVNPQGVAYSAADRAMYDAFIAKDYNLLNGLLKTYNTTPEYLKTKFGLTDADINWMKGQGVAFGTGIPLKTAADPTTTGSFSNTPGFNLAASGVKTMPKITVGGTQVATGTGVFPAVDDLQLAAGMDVNRITPQKMAVASGLGLPEVQARYWNAKNEAILGNYSVDPATGMRTPIAARAPVAQPYNNALGLTSGLSPTGPLGEYSTRAVAPVVPDVTTAGITTIPNVNYTLPGVQRAMPTLPQDRTISTNPTKLMNVGGIASLGSGGYPRRTGQIEGPGTETSDSIPAMLSDGEFVMTAKAVRGAGKGDRRAGAKRMYALMHQLEQNAARG